MSERNQNPTSPMSGSSNVRRLEIVASDELISEWRRQFSIDVSGVLGCGRSIHRYECLDTGLFFFSPEGAVGDAKLYEQLQKFPWYYRSTKWEYTAAAEIIGENDNVLEIGCGKGDFLAAIQSREGEATGIEINEAAVAAAKAAGLPVVCRPLSELCLSSRESFDVVCHFQVLEHIPQPLPFLRECLEVLRPGGKLIFAIPNMSGFVGRDKKGLLNKPPHHMLQWTESAILQLTKFLPLTLSHLLREPLEPYHASYYSYVRTQSFFDWPEGLLRWFASLSAACIAPFVRLPFIRRRIIGHTLLAVFEKAS